MAKSTRNLSRWASWVVTHSADTDIPLAWVLTRRRVKALRAEAAAVKVEAELA